MNIITSGKLTLAASGLLAASVLVPCVVSASPGQPAPGVPNTDSVASAESTLAGDDASPVEPISGLLPPDAVPCDDEEDEGDLEDEVSNGVGYTMNCGDKIKRKIARLPHATATLKIGMSDACAGHDSVIQHLDENNNVLKTCTVADGTSGECSFVVKVGQKFRMQCKGEGEGSCSGSVRAFDIK